MFQQKDFYDESGDYSKRLKSNVRLNFEKFQQEMIEQNNLDQTFNTNGINKFKTPTSSFKPLKNLPPLIQFPSQSEKTLKPGEIPDYVIKSAPVVHLYSEERYLPYDVADYVSNFHLTYFNDTNVTILDEITGLTKDKLSINDLSKFPNEKDLYLTANSDFNADPDWITGKLNKPRITDGFIENAPATLLVVDKGNGWVDSYWFYFYSFNLGPFVMGGGPYGNHVGDWEHSLVRFYNGVPQFLWMSAHGGGGGYFYKGLETYTIDNQSRPVTFSARGTHANYASVGQHSHDIPYAMLSDFTDRGALWDVTKNYLAYTYDGVNISYGKGSVPGREEKYGDWLHFMGHWGDKKLPNSDPRQKFHPFEWRYIDGPTGPLDKNLNRLPLCQRTKWWNFWGGCRVRKTVLQGEGIEGEGFGNGGCSIVIAKIRPLFLQVIIEYLTRGGIGCFIVDRIWG